ncbi:mandelate racemase [Skermanella stibiiresistens SB22]|uniref:Mandelate racemase n=1 Tax=Skermanella stibiiresistens SB22 TaxID=1385369 RepID=W9H7G5_9PROT|nr:mandelate racemase/muconate lactonizing enzyme family protein [Skermanella stibiiresistens]EWY40706.1 mandelate racemase [Skermanella stibiiresistens SB22]
MRITDIKAFPISSPIPPEKQNRLGIGRLAKRDAVLVKVFTDEGIIGWGEAHHGRNPGAVANIVNNTMHQLVVGMDPTDTVAIWDKVYKAQVASHGMGAGSVIALSGVDMACWDIRGKAVGWPVWKLLGGSDKKIPAYAGGGGALGIGRGPEELADEVASFAAKGYKAVKLRIGQAVDKDIARVAAVRKAFDKIDILTDANTAYTLDDARRVMPALAEMGVSWLEEPFPPNDYRSYEIASKYSSTPLALGENNYTRFEFVKHIESGAVRVFQPDVGKTGGFTEIMRIAAMASAWGVKINPHGGVTGLDLAAGIHVLASIDNGGYFEASEGYNPQRSAPFDRSPYEMDSDGFVRPLDRPGIGLEVDESFIERNPVIEGPGFV